MDKKIEVTITIEIDWLHSGIDELEKKLREARKEFPNAGIYFHQEWTGYEDCHDEMVVTRIETDEEFKARLKEEAEVIAEEESKAQKERIAKRMKEEEAKNERLREYLVLKKEFEE